MSFTLCPDDGPNRVVRFGELPYANVIALLDAKKNVLQVDAELYRALSPRHQDIVLRARKAFVLMPEAAHLPPIECEEITEVVAA